jgi:hypothetical protein
LSLNHSGCSSDKKKGHPAETRVDSFGVEYSLRQNHNTNCYLHYKDGALAGMLSDHEERTQQQQQKLVMSSTKDVVRLLPEMMTRKKM